MGEKIAKVALIDGFGFGGGYWAISGFASVSLSGICLIDAESVGYVLLFTILLIADRILYPLDVSEPRSLGLKWPMGPSAQKT